MDALAENIGRAATRLHCLYWELHYAKTPRQDTMRERPMNTKGRLGPVEVIPAWIISTDKTLTDRLSEYACECANHVHLDEHIRREGFQRNGRRMTQWIARNATAISELPVAPHLLEELREQVSLLNGLLVRVRKPDNIAINRQATKEKLLTAATVAAIVRRLTGLNLNRKHITRWARDGKLVHYTDNNGERCYTVADVLTFLQSDPG